MILKRLRAARELLENYGPVSFRLVQWTNRLRGLNRWPHESFSQKAEDLLIQKILKGSSGVYLDIGCFHPIIYSNTYNLYKKGWSGANVDLSEKTIEAFSRFRPDDRNICMAIGNKTEVKKAYFMENGKKSPLNTLCPKTAEEWRKIFNKTPCERSVHVLTLGDFFTQEKLDVKSIDFLNVDIEGMDLTVIEQWPFEIARPKVICVENHARNIDMLLASESHKILEKNKYELKYWLTPSLIYAKK